MQGNIRLLAAAVVCLQLGCSTAKPSPDVTANLQAVIFPPNYIGNCDNYNTLVEVMAHGLNPALTQLSLALFHGHGGDDDPLQGAADAIGNILACTEHLERLGTSTFPERGEEYRFYARQLRLHAMAGQIAALEQNAPAVTHSFSHIKDTCAVCHSRFRVAQTLEVRDLTDVEEVEQP